MMAAWIKSSDDAGCLAHFETFKIISRKGRSTVKVGKDLLTNMKVSHLTISLALE
jgi:hypothetical protein